LVAIISAGATEALAATNLYKPKLLFLDEPISAVDP
jgi:ABC-type multidrug transport system ATPase subunit